MRVSGALISTLGQAVGADVEDHREARNLSFSPRAGVDSPEEGRTDKEVCQWIHAVRWGLVRAVGSDTDLA